ncbi:small ubiquitin-like modifier 1 [Euphorbia peplus]|nr:small ubiquitin-like modifier 1 [Euphorbia peplus]
MSSTKQQVDDEHIKPTHINLKVVDQDKIEVSFSLRRNAPLKKLMNAYCQHKSVQIGSFVFLFDDGKYCGAEQTPDELKMEDGDEILAMLPQVGGANV